MRRDSTILDALRATAVLLVLAAHVAEVLAFEGWPSIEPWHWHMGRLGVLLFFVHTSLVLMLSLERTPLEGGALAFDYYVRRAFRIYPLAILTVLGVTAAGLPAVPWGEPVDATPGVLAANLALVQNLTGASSVLSPLWSLPLEVQMYLVLPFVFFGVRGGRRPGVAILLWIAGALAGLQVPTSGSHLAAFVPCFMSGVIGFCVARNRQACLPFWGFGILQAVAIGVYAGLSSIAPSSHSRVAAWGVCLAVGLAVPMFRETSSPAIRRAAGWIARYSYGIYLSHMITLWLVFVVLSDLPLVAQVALLAALLAIVPMALYHTIEGPCVRLGAFCAGWLRRELRAVPNATAWASRVPTTGKWRSG